MEQLTQMELLQIHELLGAEELALKKCTIYLEAIDNDELQPPVEAALTMHQEHITRLVDLIRLHNGKEEAQR